MLYEVITNLRSERRDGYLVEWGPNGFLDSVPEMLELVRDLGLGRKSRMRTIRGSSKSARLRASSRKAWYEVSRAASARSTLPATIRPRERFV